MQTSDQIQDIAAALNKAQQAMKPAAKDADNPHFKSKYADLAAIIAAVQGPFTEHGIAWMQDVTRDDQGINVSTRLLHTSGQWIEFGPLSIPLDKHNAHGVGSATTYAKRYSLAAAAGLATEDDDGNAATEAAPKKAPLRKPKGFDDWWLDLQVTANNGIEALKAAWTESAEPLRAYVTANLQREWAALKQTASEATGVTA